MIRKLIVLAIVLLLAAFAAVFSAPWRTAHDIRTAAREHDLDALARHIDFPALRSNLKAEFAAKMAAKQQGADGKPNDFASLFLTALVDPMVDALITPESLAKMLAANSGADSASAGAADAGTTNGTEPEPATELHGGYESLDRFAVTLRVKESGSEPVVFLLHREGLLEWKLASMRLAQLQPAAEPGK